MLKVVCHCIAFVLLAHIILLFCGCNSNPTLDNKETSDTSNSSIETNPSSYNVNYEKMDLKERSKAFVDLLLQACDYIELSSNFPVTQDIASEIHAEHYEAIHMQMSAESIKVVVHP